MSQSWQSLRLQAVELPWLPKGEYTSFNRTIGLMGLMAKTRILEETVRTVSDEPVTLSYIIRGRGKKLITLEQLNPWYDGYQTALLHVSRHAWPTCVEQLELDSRRQPQGIFTLNDDWEEVVIILDHYYWFGRSHGEVRVICEELPQEEVVLQSFFGRIFQSEPSPIPNLEAGLSCEQQKANVQILGGYLHLLSHWVVLFDFETDGLFTCELEVRGQENGANLFGVVDFRFQNETQSSDDFLRNNGYYQLEHGDIFVVTCPSELQSKCRTHPLNGLMYNFSIGNCQDWVRVLLVQGYDVDPELLPSTVGDISRHMGPISTLSSKLLFQVSPVGALASLPSWLYGDTNVHGQYSERNIEDETVNDAQFCHNSGMPEKHHERSLEDEYDYVRAELDFLDTLPVL
mmetsp:Transcript_1260/g.1130  ORF Transcript_1260/g.1130 Transcript_1260/m.1130 type:complete len:402 (-) Transcript_1260:20-1225(-)